MEERLLDKWTVLKKFPYTLLNFLSDHSKMNHGPPSNQIKYFTFVSLGLSFTISNVQKTSNINSTINTDCLQQGLIRARH